MTHTRKSSRRDSRNTSFQKKTKNASAPGRRGNSYRGDHSQSRKPQGVGRRYRETQHFASYESIISSRLDRSHLQQLADEFPSQLARLLQAPEPQKSQLDTAPETLMSQSGLQMDPWQFEAYESLLQGFHIVVDAPTSAGKTRVIEAYLQDRLSSGARLIYTSPVKSLSNDKYAEFSEKFGREKVGINTGDFKENLGAPIILATLETYRNSLLGLERDISRHLVVFDEYHYLQDPSRGSAWEEALIMTPKSSQVVLLSASVPNCNEFAQWLYEVTGQPTKVFQVTHRPVPLTHLVHTKQGWVFGDDLKLQRHEEEEILATKSRRGGRIHNFTQDLFQPVMSALKFQLGPIVVYAARRGDVENMATAFMRNLKKSYQTSRQKWDLDKIRMRVQTLTGFEYLPQDLQKFILDFGIAYHHSGLIPPGRVAIETLLKEGLLIVCFGTMGISLGVNFSVRSAFIADENRPSEGGTTFYTNSEILQMLGRAGRRGRDREGFSLWMDMGKYVLQKPKDREVCRSALRFDPTTVLGILSRYEDVEKLSHFYQRSFFYKNMQLSSQKEQLIKSVDADQALRRIVKHLQRKGALEDSSPTLLGNIARHFPQSGGLIIAHYLATGTMNEDNFHDFLNVIACFCCAHFKEIPPLYGDLKMVRSSRVEKLIQDFYPRDLFPDLYDEVGFSPSQKTFVFREFNQGVSSIVFRWLDPHTTWKQLTEEHTSKYFSDGDCMNVLFRFATFLQSLARIDFFSPKIALESKRIWNVLFREPLDARNRLLAEEIEEHDLKTQTETDVVLDRPKS